MTKEGRRTNTSSYSTFFLELVFQFYLQFQEEERKAIVILNFFDNISIHIFFKRIEKRVLTEKLGGVDQSVRNRKCSSRGL